MGDLKELITKFFTEGKWIAWKLLALIVTIVALVVGFYTVIVWFWTKANGPLLAQPGSWIARLIRRVVFWGNHVRTIVHRYANIAAAHGTDAWRRLRAIFEAHFEKHEGEIWLFNNDLEAFWKDDVFKELYREVFDKNERIKSCKLIVDDERYAEFISSANPNNNARATNIKANILKLSPERMKAIYIGKLSECGLTQKALNIVRKTSWAFYTSEVGSFGHDHDVCIARFALDPTAEEGGPEMILVTQKGMYDGISNAFEKIYKDHFGDMTKFQRIEPTGVSANGKTANGFTFVAAQNSNTAAV